MKNAQNDKIIINTIYMKLDFLIIKKLSENCNVNMYFNTAVTLLF